MATTNKNLVGHIVEDTGAKRAWVETVIQQLLDEIMAELTKGNGLGFRDFGVFETKIRAPRIARNPKTLERVEMRAKRRVVFEAGGGMRERVNASQQVTYSTVSTREAAPTNKSGPSLRGGGE